MSVSVDKGFVKQYEAEVHEAYQRMGSRLRNTVRNKGNVKGSSTTFQKVGKGVAGSKTRHGDVPVMNVDHTPVECILSDHYAGDYVDDLDELKIEHDERGVVMRAGVYALGRKTDELIVEKMETCSQQVAVDYGGASADMTRNKFLHACVTLGDNDVNMDDGDLFLVVGFQQWASLMTIAEFSDADYVSSDDLPWKGKGFSAKRWGPAMVFPFSGLPKSGNNRSCFLYHRSALGHANGQEIKTDISWENTKSSHFINSRMSQGSVLIDDNGIVEILCDESVAPAA